MAEMEPHILMIPFGASGHLYPFLQLLHRISERAKSSSCTAVVTVLTNEERRAELARMRAGGAFGGVDLRVRVAFSRPPFRPGSRFPVRAANVAATYADEFRELAGEWLGRKGAPGSPTSVVTDMYLSFGQEFARELEIPWYPFYSSSASFAIVLLESRKLQNEGAEKWSEKGDEAVDIPGIQYARVRDLPSAALEFPDFYKIHAESMSRASAILINVAEELDAPSGGLDAIRKTTRTWAHDENLEGPRVLALGPILDFPGFTAAASDSMASKKDSPSLAFLDTQPPQSVLYISFGSLANIAPQAMTELAYGLEASGVSFIWVLRFTGSLTSAVLPPGFEERTRHRGYIESQWAPQVQILLHPSTGGFLSHCGWNSVLESFCSGVPVITWPVATDQQLNARFIEKVAKTGVPVKELAAGDEVVLMPSREDVQKAVSCVMVEENGRGLRANAREMQRIAKAAVAEGGSSHRAMGTFLDEIFLKRAPH